jgi:hypothetical protein
MRRQHGNSQIALAYEKSRKQRVRNHQEQQREQRLLVCMVHCLVAGVLCRPYRTGSRITAAPPAGAMCKDSTSPAVTSRSTRRSSFGVPPSSHTVAR